jgi:signal transduction histidine kinase
MHRILPVEQALLDRARWLIRLRWIAAIGAAVMIYICIAMFHLQLPRVPLALTVLWITAYNTFFTLQHRRDGPPPLEYLSPYRSILRSFNAQIALDWTALALLLHYSGGLENPFILYFIFHAILASMLLPRRACFVHATLAILLVSAMGIAEFYGSIPHVSLFNGAVIGTTLLLYGELFAFASTILIAVFLTSEISSLLRKREEEMASLEESLRQANEALMDNDRIRSEYVLRVSHDLQSPLAASYSMLDLVLTTMSETMSEKARDFIGRSLERLQALLRFARGIHEISRIRAARSLASEPLGLRSIVQAATEEVLSQPHDRKVDLTIDVPPTVPFVLGDRNYLRTALVELIANAAQYAPVAVRITVRARVVDGCVEVEVEDTGIGIPAEEIPRIFDEFYRGNLAKELQPRGWGLGLTLVKLIVDRHNGTIRVASEPGQGTRVAFTLPAFRNGG